MAVVGKSLGRMGRRYFRRGGIQVKFSVSSSRTHSFIRSIGLNSVVLSFGAQGAVSKVTVMASRTTRLRSGDVCGATETIG